MYTYNLLKALHIIAVICWMAGLLYLPRLFVYHCCLDKNDKSYDMFCRMERRLLYYIMHPSMAVACVFGVLMMLNLEWRSMAWLHCKITLVLLMVAMHFWYSSMHKKFLHKSNQRSSRFYRIVNEVPALLMVAIVLLAVLKPW